MITIKALTFAYNRKNRLFENLNLSLEPGHIYGLLGKNGTGKSTLLHLVSGLLFPKTGNINVCDKIPRKRQVEFLQEIYLVPEEFYVPDVSPRVYAELYSSFYPKFDEKQFKEYLAEFEIDPKHNLDKMSMGQRKKAMIAFALACNTRLLVMDEPTNGLDIPSKTQFRKLIASIASDEKCILISTHQVRDLDNLIDTIVVIDEHQIIFNKSIDEISERLSFVTYNDSEKPNGIIYDESGVLGGKAVLENLTGKSSRVDIELLFNAIVSEKGKLSGLFTDSTMNHPTSLNN